MAHNQIQSNTEGRTAFTLLHIAHPTRRPVSHDELVEAFAADHAEAEIFHIEDFDPDYVDYRIARSLGVA